MSNFVFPPSISSEELLELPVAEFCGEITLVERHDQLEGPLNYLRSQKILGFDTETKPSFKKGMINKVSLLQLAAGKRVFLFRLNKIGLPRTLADILASEKNLKIGAAIRDDIRILQKLQTFSAKGFIDLQHIVKDFGIENKGVRKLAGIILQKRISKSQQLTNWEAPEMTEAQKIYAATDAWVCLEMYKKLMEIRNGE
jgi:ribonuclease D